MLKLLILALFLKTVVPRIIIGGNPNTWEPSENCKACVLVAGSMENKLLEMPSPEVCGESIECHTMVGYMKKELSNPEKFCKTVKMC